MNELNGLAERSGEIVRFDNGLAQIRLEPLSACGQCGSRGSCASGKAVEQVVQLRLSGSAGECASIGDQVTVSTPTASIVVAALLGYLLPASGLLVGAIVAELYATGDVAAVAGAALGFVAGLLGARLISSLVLADTLNPTACPSGHGQYFQSGENP